MVEMSNVTSVANAAFPFLDKAFRGTSVYERTWAWLVHDVFGGRVRVCWCCVFLGGAGVSDVFSVKPWALFVSFYLFMTACYIAGGAFFW